MMRYVEQHKKEVINVKRRKRRLGIVALMIGAILIALALSATSAEATTVKVDPGTKDVVAGDPFSINVSIDNVTDMTGDGAWVNFDPTVMQAQQITAGVISDIAIEKIDNTSGLVTFGYALFSGNFSGSGVLATIDFDTDPSAPSGIYPLTLTNVQITNSSGNETTVDEILNGSVNITGREVPPAAKNVPTLSGIGLLAVVGILAVVLAVSLNAKRKRRY